MYTKKNVITLCSAVLLSYQATAQINITSGVFPTPGTTVEYYEMNNAEKSQISGTGAGQIWNLTHAKSNFTNATAYLGVSEGQHAGFYPEANLMVKEDFEGETYYKVDNSGMRILGAVGPSFFDEFEIEATRYSPPLFLCKTPLKLNDTHTQQSNVNFNIPLDLIPDTLLSQLPLQPDSLRLRFGLTSNEVCDGEGVLKLPGKDFNVVRYLINQTAKNYLEAKVPVLGWIDASAFVDFPGVGEELYNETVIFWSPDHAHYVAQFSYDPDSTALESAEFTTHGTMLSNRPTQAMQESLTIYPNPVDRELKIENKLSKGQPYTILVVDMKGQVILIDKMQDDKSIDASHLLPGTYTLQVVNSDGRVSYKKFLKL